MNSLFLCAIYLHSLNWHNSNWWNFSKSADLVWNRNQIHVPNSMELFPPNLPSYRLSLVVLWPLALSTNLPTNGHIHSLVTIFHGIDFLPTYYNSPSRIFYLDSSHPKLLTVCLYLGHALDRLSFWPGLQHATRCVFVYLSVISLPVTQSWEVWGRDSAGLQPNSVTSQPRYHLLLGDQMSKNEDDRGGWELTLAGEHG